MAPRVPDGTTTVPECSWDDISDMVDRDTLQKALELRSTDGMFLREVTDRGYDRTFELTLLFHGDNWAEHYCLRTFNNSTQRARILNAAGAFAHAGHAPRIVAHAERWSLESWLGRTLDMCQKTTQDFKDVGRLLASVHKGVDPEWFSPHFADVLQRAPGLQSMPAQEIAPYAMIRLAGGGEPDALKLDSAQYEMIVDTANTSLLRAWCACDDMLPRMPLTRRLVSLHGDAHAGNVVRRSGGSGALAFIDFELACVSHAAYDIAHAMETIVRGSYTENKHIRHEQLCLLLAYLEESGMPPPTNKDLCKLRLDCIILHHCARYLHLRWLPADPEACLQIIECVHSYARGLRQSETCAFELLDHPHPAAYIADTLGAQVHALGGLLSRAATIT